MDLRPMKRLLFNMLNPSQAGWPKSDQTISKLCGFTSRIALATAPANMVAFRGVEPEVMDGGAVFSEDGKYRYRLWRVLGRRGRATGHLHAFARFDVVNMYGLIATHQRDLWEHVCPISHDGLGVENERHVREALAEADTVIAAWGGLPRELSVWRREKEVLDLLSASHEVHCLGKTKDGEPRHPSRLPYSAQLEVFRESSGARELADELTRIMTGPLATVVTEDTLP
jgi:hypothetical protein